MQARGPLMIEHRLIARMFTIIQDALGQAEKARAIAPLFVDQAVDFIRTYADRTTTGKKKIFYFVI